jgi:predicted dehydrogenase
MKNNKLKIGIVGCGGIATNKHLPALKKMDQYCEMVAFCDIIEERAQVAAADYGTNDAKVYIDYLEMYQDSEIDVIHVLTPNVSHCPATVAAFAAGKHVMCEKPMAHNTEDAKKMLDAWKKSGKKFTIGYQNRFRADIQNLKRACEAGELGDIYYGKAHAVRRRAVPTWGVFPDKSQQGGGPLIDIGTHALDMTLWCMDNYRPQRVTGSVFYKLGHLEQAVEGNLFGPWDPKTYEVEDSAMGFIQMEDGTAIHLEASWALNILDSREASTTLCGTKAGAEVFSGIGYPKEQLIYNRGHNGQLMEEKLSLNGNVAFFEGDSGDPATLEAKQWLEAILNDHEPLVKPEQAYVVTEILEAIYRSAAEGKEITLKK